MSDIDYRTVADMTSHELVQLIGRERELEQRIKEKDAEIERLENFEPTLVKDYQDRVTELEEGISAIYALVGEDPAIRAIVEGLEVGEGNFTTTHKTLQSRHGEMKLLVRNLLAPLDATKADWVLETLKTAESLQAFIDQDEGA